MWHSFSCQVISFVVLNVGHSTSKIKLFKHMCMVFGMLEYYSLIYLFDFHVCGSECGITHVSIFMSGGKKRMRVCVISAWSLETDYLTESGARLVSESQPFFCLCFSKCHRIKVTDMYVNISAFYMGPGDLN